MMRLLEPAVAAVDQLPAGRVAHVRAPDLSEDPVGTIAEAYRALGMELGDEARLAMHEYMRAKREKGSARHIHKTEAFGLDPAAIHERFAELLRPVRPAGLEASVHRRPATPACFVCGQELIDELLALLGKRELSLQSEAPR